MLKSISSSTNEDFKKLLDLSRASGIRKQGQFLVLGEKIIHENRNELQGKIKAEIRTEKLPAQFPDATQWVLLPELFNQIDILGTHFNLLLLDCPEISPADLSLPPQGLELIVPLGDPTNLGALARSAWAFGIKKLILTQEAVSPFHPKSIKASSGTLLKMQFLKTGPLEQISTKPLWALDMDGESLGSVKFPKDLRLILGEEGPGLGALKQKGSIQRTIAIPIQGVESLNATVAASILLFEYRNQFLK